MMDKDWDQAVTRHPAGCILQTSLWGRLKADFGWTWEIVSSDSANLSSGGALVLSKSLPLKLGCICYTPRGPVTDWENPHAISAVISAIEARARQKKAWAMWLEPEILRNASAGEVLRTNGYRRSRFAIQPSSTIIVNISVSEEDILAQMKSKTRYNIRLARRKGVQVEEGGLDDLDAFYSLMNVTSKRDKFGIHSRRYYERLLELFLPAGQAGLIMAKVEGELAAALGILALGKKSWYIAGASSNEYRNLMPTYAVQWGAIQWAKSRGCLMYDLWGVPDENEETLEAEFVDRNDGLWGVYRFKRGFGGELVRYAGLWEKALHPLYPLSTQLYKAIRV
jgi:peptidoglycan pentaglycine glycine transferase (the first glycine)